MLRLIRLSRPVLAALFFAALPPLVRAAEPEAPSRSGDGSLVVVYDAERRLALVPEGTVIPKGLKVFVQQTAVSNAEGKSPSGDRRPRAVRPLVFGIGDEDVMQAARDEAAALGLFSSGVRRPLAAAQTQSCTDVLVWLAPNVFHRAINCSQPGSWAMFTTATTKLGADLVNTNASPYSTRSWHCEPPNQVCELDTDTAGYGGLNWTRSEAWVESIYRGHGPDAGETIVYYSSLSF